MTIPFKQTLTKEQALQKLKHYCSYQERCHQEVKEKLYSLGMRKTEVDELLSQLIEENYLNEERFAIHYAGSKFRMKQWGRVKIKYALTQKQVSEYCINKALSQLDVNDYVKTLEKLTLARLEFLSEEPNHFLKTRKMQDYLSQKGFEPELIREVLNSLK